MSTSCPSRNLFARTLLALFAAGALPSCSDPAGPRPATPGASKLVLTVFSMPAHGLALALRTPAGRTILIDAGGKMVGYEAGRDTIGPWLKSRGIDRIDTLLVSHPDRDHYAGASFLLENFKVDRFVDGGLDSEEIHGDYRRLRQQAKTRGCLYRTVGDGESLDWDPALKVDVLSPPKGGLKPENEEDRNSNNNNSLVIRVEHGKNVFLIPGDIQRIGRDYLLEHHRADRLKATVLVAPHHGFSHGKRFAEITKPEIVVVSCKAEYPGKDIVSPGKEAKDFFGALGARVLVTAWDGTIDITSDGNSCSVETKR